MGISDNEHTRTTRSGAMRPSLQITWADEDGAFGPNRRNRHGGIRNMATRVTTTSGRVHTSCAPNGVFRWDFDATDVAAAGSIKFSSRLPTDSRPHRRTFIALMADHGGTIMAFQFSTGARTRTRCNRNNNRHLGNPAHSHWGGTRQLCGVAHRNRVGDNDPALK